MVVRYYWVSYAKNVDVDLGYNLVLTFDLTVNLTIKLAVDPVDDLIDDLIASLTVDLIAEFEHIRNVLEPRMATNFASSQS